ncbi:MAG: hypothetical protein QM708_15025 [Propioniciclava sp.]|uniref:hypothetical protein n=1 Tax=Propioniciclava sp. TaxID=2038686 RepID=UPI0039E5C9D5
MKRVLTTCAVAAVAALGLSACSGAPGASTTPSTPAAPAASATPTPANTTSAPAQTSSGTQSVQAACLSLAGPLTDANTEMSKLASVSSNDPQSAVDSWTALVNAFASFKDTVSNPEVKDAATSAHKDLAAVRDAMKKVYVDKDMAAMGDYTTATNNMQTSYTALMTLCSR